ncbi:DUF6199 family natural product biosynthesis protein [Clostridium sp. BNL1100]|uniref:DUF6199 family natural product biosynthesis protein n=1 Tax=Clostridium sp. BNL1100 TaxID=755731 RepID=UPI00024A76B7|nr:DUF6199 family natural product biosynthesis protein [Clostridium sp. BNL1100]AEY65586.1 hypothetical protein Clo1100_1348 [Clostridium sp. BNL1100]
MPKGVMIFPFIIIGLIFTIGLLNVICPKLLWKTFESWKATKEPSNAYFYFTKNCRYHDTISESILSGVTLQAATVLS